MTPMYLDFFGVADPPFSIAPDPRYLFMSQKHREALAHLLYGVKSDDGFVVLTGDVGTGKTTVCRCLLEQLPADCEVALIFNPKLSVPELLASICEEFRISLPEPHPGVKTYIDRINAWLLAVHGKGRMAVLIIDEAQSLGVEVLEQVRLLTNLETNRRKLLRILLLGQPQLRSILARPDMSQLAQRIVARYHLEPLSRPEMLAYVMHRLAVAGASRELFSPAALDCLYRLTGGVPRLVNIIADRALLGAYVQGQGQVAKATILRAAQEVSGKGGADGRRSLARAAVLGLGALCGTAAAVAAYVHYDWPRGAVVSAPPAGPTPVSPILPARLDGPPAPGPAAVRAAPAEQPAAPLPGNEASPPVLLLGSRGPAVQRLRQDLARIRGTMPVEAPNPLFDPGLSEEVRRFQAAEGLRVDGMVGPETRLRLGRALRPAKPGADERQGG